MSTLDSIAQAIVDCEHKTAPEGDGYALSVGTRAMKEGRILLDACKRVSEDTYGKWTRRMRPIAGDLILAREAPVGQVVRVPDHPLVCLGQRTVMIRPDPSVVHPRFLHYWLLGPDAQHSMNSVAAGATIPHLNVADIRSLDVSQMPRDPKQQTVAADTLGAIDDLIENNRRRVVVLEEMARAIYREWFVHFRYPGHEDVPLVDSPLGPIPDGWRVGSVDELVTLNKETVDPSAVKPSTPAVGLEHIPRRQITLEDWGEAGSLGSRKATFKTGDVLFGKIRPYFHKVSVAPVDGICSTDALVLRPCAEQWGQAVLTIASDDFVANAVQTSNGTKMPRADWKVIREFPVAIPTVEIGRRFSEIAAGLLDHAQTLMFQARSLASIRDLLLPKLVTGQIDVSRLDLDALTEAASA